MKRGFVLLVVVVHVLLVPGRAASPSSCCNESHVAKFRFRCLDAEKISLSCDENDRYYLLDNGDSRLLHFRISNDGAGGEDYLDVYNGGYIVRQPHFCVDEFPLFDETPWKAVYCVSRTIRKSDQSKIQSLAATSNITMALLWMSAVLAAIM